MRMIVLLWLVGALATAGCSTHDGLLAQRDREVFQARQAHYRKLASQASPDTWRAGAEWEFVAAGKDGASAESFVVRVTETPQDACVSGDWRKLEIVSGNGGKLHNPGYAIEGRILKILLSTALCDAYPMYQGELSGKGFTGTHNLTHMLGGKDYGKVSGRLLHVSP